MTRDEAKRQYRSAWQNYCMTSNITEKLVLEEIMDDLQPEISVGPNDPEWQSFIKTLPGFEEFWGRVEKSQLEP